MISPAPGPSEGQGSASSAEGWSPPFLGFWRLVCEPEGHRDPRTHSVQGLLSGEGAFYLPPHRPFFTLHVSSPPPFFFFVAFEAGYRIGLRDATEIIMHRNARAKSSPEQPRCHWCLFGRRGKCCAFFWDAFFWRLPPCFFPKFCPSKVFSRRIF